jgi:hypothetical protein
MPIRLVGALTILLGLALAVATAQSSRPYEPDNVYLSYLSAVQATKSLDDLSFAIYLSKAAQQKLAGYRATHTKRACDPCPSPQEELRMAKAMRPYPGPSVRPVRSESGGIVTLTYKWREPPGSLSGIGTEGTEVSVKVELVQEQGWKLKHESWVLFEDPGTMTARGNAVWSY